MLGLSYGRTENQPQNLSHNAGGYAPVDVDPIPLDSDPYLVIDVKSDAAFLQRTTRA